MKKKILALLMVMVLAMTALVGCGDKKDDKSSSTGTKATEEKSSFFKEFKELSDLKTGTEKVQLKYVIKNDEMKNSEEAKDFLDADGNLTVDLTFDVITESQTKVATDVSAKIGSKIDGKMMTVVVDGDEVYLEYAGLLDALKGLNNEQINSGLAQIESNFGKAIKVNVKTVSEAIKPILEQALASQENSQASPALKAIVAVFKDIKNNPEGLNEVIKTASDAAEKHFENLTGVDGDMYTLTINKDNAKDMLDDTEAFIKEDGQKIAEAFVEYVCKVAGDDAFGKPQAEIKEKIPGGVEKLVAEMDKNKDKTLEELQKSNLDAVMKINVNEGKDAKFSIAMKMDSEGTTIDYTGDVEFKAGSASIADKIPQDANDITTMINMLINQYGSMLTQGAAASDDSTTDIY
ncbi:MAG: hypothetical protein K6G85_03005 [Eubacterium sp.]|nr:hypothetical protein [Eubacterium sp.]